MDIDINLLKRIEKILNNSFNPISLTADDLIEIIEELVNEVEHREEKVKELENTIASDYELKNVNPYEEYGVSEKDFI